MGTFIISLGAAGSLTRAVPFQAGAVVEFFDISKPSARIVKLC
jgi:hypothetical protein